MKWGAGSGRRLMGALPPALRTAEPLSRLTSLKVGGPADFFLASTSWSAIEEALAWAVARELPATVLGGGSNLLVSDEGVAGLVMRPLAKGVVWPTPEQPWVIAEAGLSLPALARSLAKKGWSGLEWAANVPGSVGGAVTNNAGAFGSCVAEHLIWLEIIPAASKPETATGPGRRRVLRTVELRYAYRTSLLKQRELETVCVTRAAFALEPERPEVAVETVTRFQRQRSATQPRENSAGSVFANPEAGYAGRLIEQCGLKGTRRGGAEISIRHSNFIVNHGGATARDVLALIQMVQRAVWQEQGVWLQPEIELVGRWTEADRQAVLEPRTLGAGVST